MLEVDTSFAMMSGEKNGQAKKIITSVDGSTAVPFVDFALHNSLEDSIIEWLHLSNVFVVSFNKMWCENVYGKKKLRLLMFFAFDRMGKFSTFQ